MSTDRDVISTDPGVLAVLTVGQQVRKLIGG
jgi:hypothetical protein